MFKFKAHQYFWITCLFFLLLWFYWSNSDDAFDINIHDTYFVIANSHILKLLFVLYGFTGFIFWAFYKTKVPLIKILTKLHVLITIGSVPVYFLGLKLFKLYPPNTNFPLIDDLSNENMFLTLLFLFVIIVQLLFIINLSISPFKNFKRKS